MFKRKIRYADSFTGLIGAAMQFLGNITFKGTLQIDGLFEGDIAADPNDSKECTLITSVGSIVKANKISVQNAVLGGHVTCESIRVEDTIRLLAGTRIVNATIYYRTMEIQQGALLHECKLVYLDNANAQSQQV